MAPAQRFTSMPEADVGVRYDVAPDYIEHARREALGEHDQPDLPRDA